jgi:hypothetical protein
MIRPTQSLALAAVLSLATPIAALAAGNVLAVVQRGSLKVLGDSVGNAIHVVPGAAPQTWDVETLDGVTTVNGSLAPFHAIGVENNLKFDMQEGDDDVLLEDATASNDVEVVTGSGADHVEIDDSHLSGNLRIATGVDDDEVVIGTSILGGSVVVQTDSGADLVSMDLVTAADRVKLSMGTGADDIVIGGSSQFFDVVTIATANGNDSVVVDDTAFMRNLDVTLGEDDDSVMLSSTTTKDDASLNGGSETDTYINGGGNDFAFGI